MSTLDQQPELLGEALGPEHIEMLRKKAKGDLYFFCKGVLGMDRLTPSIHQPLCRLLELWKGYGPHLSNPWSAFEVVVKDALRRMRIPEDQWEARCADIKANGIRRLLILFPRTWYKTTVSSIGYPLWRGINDTNFRCLLTQNTATNAVAKGNALAGLVDGNAMLRFLFPEILPTPRSKWSESGRCLNREKSFPESTYEFAGTRTQATSRHFNDVIEDDTVAPDKDDLGQDSILPSQEDVGQAIGYHRLVPPLLDEIATDRNIVVGTRWFVHDLISWVQANEPSFIVYQRAVREDADGQPCASGALQWSERFSERVLQELAASLGPYLYSCLYLNLPVQSEDMLFKLEWVKYYDVETPRLMKFTTVDVGGDPMDTKGQPDYNVVLTCGKDMDGGQIYVLDYARERCSPSRLLEMIFEAVEKWHPVTVGLETVQYQKSLMHWIRQRQVTTGDYFSVTQLQHNKASKTARIRGLQPAMSAGVLRIRTGMQALVNEMLVYPLGTNDDLLDALAMQLELWKVTPSCQERAESFTGGPNDVAFVLAACAQEQQRQNEMKKVVSKRPPPAWGASIPVSVFQPGGRSKEARGWWGSGIRLGGHRPGSVEG
jgi:predicted phage terminase large subunit-like protein